MRAQGIFVAGTDTGVGKTRVATALLRAWAARGLRVAGMKPVAAGALLRNGQLSNADVEALRAAANVDVPPGSDNPYCFAPAIAPHIAARQAGVSIELARIRAAFEKLAAGADRVVVEGVGGLLVPLNASEDMGHLAQALSLPVVLVVGLRLGCLNHALLTVEAIAARGLALAGWVANAVDPEMEQTKANLAALERRIPAPLTAHLRHGAMGDGLDWGLLERFFAD